MAPVVIIEFGGFGEEYGRCLELNKRCNEAERILATINELLTFSSFLLALFPSQNKFHRRMRMDTVLCGIQISNG